MKEEIQAIISLPAPELELEFPLMKALQKRRTIRSWNNEELSLQEISNLLWAACGISLPATEATKAKRTAPSGKNTQSIKVYVALKSGLYLFDEKQHQLVLIHGKDIRNHIGNQPIMQTAPLGLIFVCDYNKLEKYPDADDKKLWFIAGTDTAFISQNVYLYCAAANYSTVLLGSINREKLHEVMELKNHEKVVYTQVVGKK